MIFFSPTTGGFYRDDVHANMPRDVLEVPADLHASLIAGQAKGQVIVPGLDGMPQLQDPIVTDADAAATARAQRKTLLAECDWVVQRAFENGDAVPAAWKTYRQALRDVPTQKGFPRAIKWPAAPAA